MNIITRSEAKANNYKFYYTGKPCKHGHITKRLLSNGKCYQCSTEQSSSWKNDNKPQVNEYNSKYRDINRTQLQQLWKRGSAAYRDNNQDLVRLQRQLWRQNNKGHQNYLNRKRQKQITLATPPWVDQNAIKQIYIQSALLTEEHQTEYHVDHIIPLQHELVCGLHVPWNLQIIHKTDNLTKSNKLIS